MINFWTLRLARHSQTTIQRMVLVLEGFGENPTGMVYVLSPNVEGNPASVALAAIEGCLAYHLLNGARHTSGH